MARGWLSATVALCLLWSGGAAAQDDAVLTQCLAEADTAAADLACRDMVFDACLDRTGDDSTAGMAGCLAEEQRAWDAQLNALWPQVQELAEAADPAAAPQQALTDAQRRWIDYRDAECEWQLRRQEGSIRQILVAACMRDMTAERVVDFRSWLRDAAAP